MAKFSGKVGYVMTIEQEDNPGVWIEQSIEKQYYGDTKKNYSKYQDNDINGDIVIRNIVSIVADPFACENFQHIRYVTFMNSKWKVLNAEIEYPRIILSLGGLYNE